MKHFDRSVIRRFCRSQKLLENLRCQSIFLTADLAEHGYMFSKVLARMRQIALFLHLKQPGWLKPSAGAGRRRSSAAPRRRARRRSSSSGRRCAPFFLLSEASRKQQITRCSSLIGTLLPRSTLNFTEIFREDLWFLLREACF